MILDKSLNEGKRESPIVEQKMPRQKSRTMQFSENPLRFGKSKGATTVIGSKDLVNNKSTSDYFITYSEMMGFIDKRMKFMLDRQENDFIINFRSHVSDIYADLTQMHRYLDLEERRSQNIALIKKLEREVNWFTRETLFLHEKLHDKDEELFQLRRGYENLIQDKNVLSNKVSELYLALQKIKEIKKPEDALNKSCLPTATKNSYLSVSPDKDMKKLFSPASKTTQYTNHKELSTTDNSGDGNNEVSLLGIISKFVAQAETENLMRSIEDYMRRQFNIYETNKDKYKKRISILEKKVIDLNAKLNFGVFDAKKFSDFFWIAVNNCKTKKNKLQLEEEKNLEETQKKLDKSFPDESFEKELLEEIFRIMILQNDSNSVFKIPDSSQIKPEIQNQAFNSFGSEGRSVSLNSKRKANSEKKVKEPLDSVAVKNNLSLLLHKEKLINKHIDRTMRPKSLLDKSFTKALEISPIKLKIGSSEKSKNTGRIEPFSIFKAES